MIKSESPLNILVVDDNPSIHEDFKKILISKKESKNLNELKSSLFDESKTDLLMNTYTIDSAMNGAQALAMVENSFLQKKRYALIFMDVVMPIGWDGIETTRRVWEVDPDVQVVICSAFSDYSWEAIVEKLGVNDNFLILKKPFEKIEISQIACCLTQKWLMAQNPGHKYDKLYSEIIEVSKDVMNRLNP